VANLAEAVMRCPTSDVDPFSDAFLSDPYPQFEALRALGPVVWLNRYNVLALTGDAEVRAVLNDHETFCSSRGVGPSDFKKEKPWKPPSLLLETDPPAHTTYRATVMRVLAPGALRVLRPVFEEVAAELISRLVERREFDAMADLAQVFPLKVFADAVGLPEEGREKLLPYGEATFNAFGPHNARFAASMAKVEGIGEWVMERCRRENLSPGGLGRKVYEGADRGDVTEEEATILVRSFLSAGIDTTIIGISNAIYSFLQFPGEWDKIHADPSLARNAFEEVLRYESPFQCFFRTTTRETRIADVDVPEGQKIFIMIGAANRDPSRWEEPDRFDITRRTSGHLGFGAGIHGCIGQAAARLEVEVVLAELARRVRRIEQAGPEQRMLHNSLRGVTRLPVRVEPA
jgi:4-methoxybenzoate monooxygenase (O-demethylating)